MTEDCTDPEGSSPDTAVSSDDPPVCTPADSDSVGSILIEKGTGSVDAASIRVTTDTRLLAADGAGGWLPTTFDQLAAGTRVQVWFTGPVAESYPVQATAAAIARESEGRGSQGPRRPSQLAGSVHQETAGRRPSIKLAGSLLPRRNLRGEIGT